MYLRFCEHALDDQPAATPTGYRWRSAEPAQLKAKIVGKGLAASLAVKALLVRYRALILANKTEFDTCLSTAMTPFAVRPIAALAD